jgi:hypothetical protein
MSNSASPQHLEITLPSGNVALLLRSDGDKTSILSPEPAPPGSTVRGRIIDMSVEFQLKVRNCIKRESAFEIDGRVMNATRPMKERLARSPQH